MRQFGLILALIWSAIVASIVARRQAKGSPMPKSLRLANRTIWALEDIIIASKTCWGAWNTAQARAEHSLDPIMLAALGRIAEQLTAIETKAIQARSGRYEER